MKSVCVPAGYLLEYLQAGGLSDRMAMLAGRSLSAQPLLERALDLSLELSLLLATSPFPDRLQEKLLQSLDELGGRLLVRADGPGCGPSGMDLGVASTRAEALNLILAGWARAWSPSALLERPLVIPSADTPQDATPVIKVVETNGGTAAAGTDYRGRDKTSTARPLVEFLPDGSVVRLDAGSLKAALDNAEDELLRGLPQAATGIQDLANWIRYAFGSGYNSWNQPAKAFAFMELLLPACHRHETTRGNHGTEGLPAGLDSELPDEVVELWHLALRATSLQLALPPAPELSGQSASGGILPQQLTGLAAAPGRASGRVSRSSGRPLTPRGSSGGTVIICKQLSLPLMAARPAAVLERDGSRLGLGALLARDAGIPCISGIGDLTTLPDGLPVMVDGYLGLATIHRGAGRA
ncbi:MAG: PEP-utilizing enzyme [Clostridia bacterium]|jgi:phosphohistidine swiveling domain-containing protein